MSEAGKGSLTIPPNDGDLIKGFTDAYTVRGDTKGFGGSTTSSPIESKAPIWTEGRSTDANATNSLGAVGGTESDSMFEKFYRGQLDKVTGSESAEGVASTGLVDGGAKSDPEGQELANEQSLGAGALSSKADKD